MTQSGARINEWLDYYNGGKCMFNHMEQMNCVGNNDLCNIDPTILGTGNDSGKSNAKFFHYFYCYEIPNDERLIVKAHNVNVKTSTSTTEIPIPENRYIPSIYYFKTKGVMYVVANSEVTKTTCEKWFGLYGDVVNGATQSINLYTGIEIRAKGEYNNRCQNTNRVFYPVYETIYSWLKANEDGDKKKIVFACHEIPFTVITRASLNNSKEDILGYTRNYPNGSSSLLGSHMNQLDATEDRGTYWISRLLEHFGCKLCIGGHKHTYALSYPIKENYQWTNSEGKFNSLVRRKEMLETLEDECGENPINNISWIVVANDDGDNEYNIGEFTTDISISSTKLPYIPSGLYNNIGLKKFNDGDAGGYYRCCTPTDTSNNTKYDGFVNYSMCQATGYKLKSNKELPCAYQVFSKLIPMTSHKDGKDTANGNQLYPMFSVIDFKQDANGDINAINVRMCRVEGIFKENGKDLFTQTNYGNGELSIKCLVEVNPNNAITIGNIIGSTIPDTQYMYGAWIPYVIPDSNFDDSYINVFNENKYLYIEY